MALTIVPGYSFAVNEVPTKALFERMVRDMQVSGVDAGLIEGGLTAIVYGDSSGTSGSQPSGVGWIWVDPGGNRVVQPNSRPDLKDGVPFADVRLWVAAGGWETVLIRQPGTGPIPGGQHLWYSADFRVNDLQQDMDLDFTPVGFADVSTASPATNARVTCRGMGEVSVATQVTESLLKIRRPGILTDNINQSTWKVLDTFTGDKAHFAGIILGRSHATLSGGSFAADKVAAWFVARNLGKS